MAVVDRAAPVPQAAAPLSDDQLLLQAVLRAAAELELSRTALARVLAGLIQSLSPGRVPAGAAPSPEVP
jgi:hypothetical protein